MAHLYIATASSYFCLSFPPQQPLLCLEHPYLYTSVRGVSVLYQARSFNLIFLG